MAQIISSPFTTGPHTHPHPAPHQHPSIQKGLVPVSNIRFNPTTTTTLDLRHPTQQTYSYPSPTQYKAYIIRRKLPQIGGRRSWTQVDIVEDPVSPYDSLISQNSPHRKPSKYQPWRGRSTAEIYDSLRLDLQRSAVDYLLQGLNGMEGEGSQGGMRWDLADLQVRFGEVGGGWRRGVETRQIRVVVKRVVVGERGLLHHWSLPGDLGGEMRWEQQQQRQSVVVDAGGAGYGRGHEHYPTLRALPSSVPALPAIIAPVEEVIRPIAAVMAPITHRPVMDHRHEHHVDDGWDYSDTDSSSDHHPRRRRHRSRRTNKVVNNFDKGYGGPTTIHNYHPSGQLPAGSHQPPTLGGPSTRRSSKPIILTSGVLDEELLNLDGPQPGDAEGYGKKTKGKGEKTPASGLKQATGHDHGHGHDHGRQHHEQSIKHVHHEHHPSHAPDCTGHIIPDSFRKYFEGMSLGDGERGDLSTGARGAHHTHHKHPESQRQRRRGDKHPLFEYDDIFDEINGNDGWESTRERRRPSAWSNVADDGHGHNHSHGHRRRNDGTGRRSYLDDQMW